MPDYTRRRMAASPALGWLPEHIVRFWRALDLCFGRVEPTWWGAVVTDPRFPAVWDVNYARVDVAADDLSLEEIETALAARAPRRRGHVEHVVSFHPEATAGLLDQLEARGHRLTRDLVMEVDGDPPDDGLRRVERSRATPSLWRSVEGRSACSASTSTIVAQLAAIERDVLAPSGKRWFGVRDERRHRLGRGLMLLERGRLHRQRRHVRTRPRARTRERRDDPHRQGSDGPREPRTPACWPTPTTRGRRACTSGWASEQVGRLASTRGPSLG